MDRRAFLKNGSTAALGLAVGGCALPFRSGGSNAAAPAVRHRLANLAPVEVSFDRIIRTTVCLRPHRDPGFVVRAERLDDKMLVHNYGHGGAGMSLSWGTGALAADLAVQSTDRTAAVIGCGIVGLTAARQLQRRGFTVTIYAMAIPPETTSNNLWGGFTPNSGLVTTNLRTPEWDDQYRRAVQVAYRQHQLLVGAGYGVSWINSFAPTDTAAAGGGRGGAAGAGAPTAAAPPAAAGRAAGNGGAGNGAGAGGGRGGGGGANGRAGGTPPMPAQPPAGVQTADGVSRAGGMGSNTVTGYPAGNGAPGDTATGVRQNFPDATGVGSILLGPGEHPFPTKYARQSPYMRFEPSIYLEALMRDVILFGGRIVVRKFDTPRDFSTLTEAVIVNSTGLGARALFGDEEIYPVKGQLVVLAPQPEVNYTMGGMMPRSDGIILGHVMQPGVWSLDVDEAARQQVVNDAITRFSTMKSPIRGVPITELPRPAVPPSVDSFFDHVS